MDSKIINLILIFSFIIWQSHGHEIKCENEGCYEVIKTFVKLLEEKINETDKILAEAEKELNEVTFGNDEKFENKILELDTRLKKLIIEMNTGIDGGEYSLFDLINSVHKQVNQVEENLNFIEVAIDDGNKITQIAQVQYTDINDAIQKIQEEYNKLLNKTETDMPNALQDAFDKSKKFHSDTKELRDILDNMKTLLTVYENNLISAKDLTSQTLQKLKEVSAQMDATEKNKKETEDKLKDVNTSKLPVHEAENVKKLVKEAQEKAKIVFDDSLDLLNDISLLELYGKMNDIKNKIKNLDDYSVNEEKNLKKFSEENSAFLDEVETTLDKALDLQQKAFTQRNQINDLLKEIQDIEDIAKNSISDKDEIIVNARNIYKTLEDFNMKVEESRENARTAFEKISEIKKNISSSKDIVKNLEEKVKESMRIALDAKDKCTSSKKEMDEILTQTTNVKDAVENLTEEVDENLKSVMEVQKTFEHHDRNHEKLKKAENETEDFIQRVKVKVDKTKAKEHDVEKNVDLALKNLQEIMKQIDGMKDVDIKSLEEFEVKINELENDIKASKLLENYGNMKDIHQQQKELMERYRVEIAMLEHEVKTIKENAESLENRCFKRTRLEP